MIVLGASRQPGDRVLRNPPKRIRIWHSLAPDCIAPQWALQRTVTVKRIKCTRVLFGWDLWDPTGVPAFTFVLVRGSGPGVLANCRLGT